MPEDLILTTMVVALGAAVPVVAMVLKERYYHRKAVRRGRALVGMGLEEMRAHIDGLPPAPRERALSDVVAYWHEIGRQQQ